MNIALSCLAGAMFSASFIAPHPWYQLCGFIAMICVMLARSN